MDDLTDRGYELLGCPPRSPGLSPIDVMKLRLKRPRTKATMATQWCKFRIELENRIVPESILFWTSNNDIKKGVSMYMGILKKQRPLLKMNARDRIYFVHGLYDGQIGLWNFRGWSEKRNLTYNPIAYFSSIGGGVVGFAGGSVNGGGVVQLFVRIKWLNSVKVYTPGIKNF